MPGEKPMILPYEQWRLPAQFRNDPKRHRNAASERTEELDSIANRAIVRNRPARTPENGDPRKWWTHGMGGVDTDRQ